MMYRSDFFGVTQVVIAYSKHAAAKNTKHTGSHVQYKHAKRPLTLVLVHSWHTVWIRVAPSSLDTTIIHLRFLLSWCKICRWRALCTAGMPQLQVPLLTGVGVTRPSISSYYYNKVHGQKNSSFQLKYYDEKESTLVARKHTPSLNSVTLWLL